MSLEVARSVATKQVSENLCIYAGENIISREENVIQATS